MKRKISLQQLAEEMPILNMLDQAHLIGGGDGSYSNPFTQSEVDALINSDSFYGGYVQDGFGGISYWLPSLTVYGTGYSGYGQNVNTSNDLFYLPQNGASFGNGDCSYVNISYGYGGLDFLLDLISHSSEANTGIYYGAGKTQLGSNFQLYYETKTGRVFCGNQYVGTTSLKGLAETANRAFSRLSILVSAYKVYDAGTNQGIAAAGQVAAEEVSAYYGAIGGAKLGACIGAWCGPATALTFGVIGAVAGAVAGPAAVDYLIIKMAD